MPNEKNAQDRLPSTVSNTDSKQMIALYYTLHDDVSACIKQKDSQGNRRSLIRAVFAFVEGFTYRFKLLALDEATRQKTSLSAGEISVLAGQAFSVDDNGHIRVRRLQISPSANLQLTTRLAARCFNVDIPKPAESNVGWNRFNKAVKLRNRITHPNSVSELAVSDAELQLVNHAFMWSVSIFALLLTALVEKLNRDIEELDRKVGSANASSQEFKTKLKEMQRRYTDAMSSVISQPDT